MPNRRPAHWLLADSAAPGPPEHLLAAAPLLTAAVRCDANPLQLFHGLIELTSHILRHLQHPPSPNDQVQQRGRLERSHATKSRSAGPVCGSVLFGPGVYF